MSRILQQRTAGVIEGDFVVFVIGMRMNRFWKVHKWLPIAWAFRRAPGTVQAAGRRVARGPPDARRHAESPVCAFWRSFEHLERFARDPDKAHLPTWAAFNKRVGTSGDVGIWHETFGLKAGI